jgi:hypothetical protein
MLLHHRPIDADGCVDLGAVTPEVGIGCGIDRELPAQNRREQTE